MLKLAAEGRCRSRQGCGGCQESAAGWVLSRVVDKAFEDVEIVDAVKIFVYIGREAV